MTTKKIPCHPATFQVHRKLVELRGRAADWIDTGRADGFEPATGICDNLVLTMDERAFLGDLMALWPGNSGNWYCPVPHPDKWSERAYETASSQEMWSPDYEYARNRWALLDWLIEQTAPTTANN